MSAASSWGWLRAVRALWRAAPVASDQRKLDEREVSDAIHRAGFPRVALGEATGKATIAAAAVADHACGVTRVDNGPDPARGTLRWCRVYIAELDRRADALSPGWRTEPSRCGPSAWAVEHFGPVNPAGDEPEMPDDIYEHSAWIRSGLTTSQWNAAKAGGPARLTVTDTATAARGGAR